MPGGRLASEPSVAAPPWLRVAAAGPHRVRLLPPYSLGGWRQRSSRLSGPRLRCWSARRKSPQRTASIDMEAAARPLWNWLKGWRGMGSCPHPSVDHSCTMHCAIACNSLLVNASLSAADGLLEWKHAVGCCCRSRVSCSTTIAGSTVKQMGLR